MFKKLPLKINYSSYSELISIKWGQLHASVHRPKPQARSNLWYCVGSHIKSSSKLINVHVTLLLHFQAPSHIMLTISDVHWSNYFLCETIWSHQLDNALLYHCTRRYMGASSVSKFQSSNLNCSFEAWMGGFFIFFSNRIIQFLYLFQWLITDEPKWDSLAKEHLKCPSTEHFAHINHQADISFVNRLVTYALPIINNGLLNRHPQKQLAGQCVFRNNR